MRGGIRPNAGAKKGSHHKDTTTRRKFQNYTSEKEVMEVIRVAKELAKTDPSMLRWVLEQVFGKAPQRVEMSGEDGKSLIITFDTAFSNRNEKEGL